MCCKYRLTLTPYVPCAASTDWPWPLCPICCKYRLTLTSMSHVLQVQTDLDPLCPMCCKYRLTLTSMSHVLQVQTDLDLYVPCVASTDWPWPPMSHVLQVQTDLDTCVPCAASTVWPWHLCSMCCKYSMTLAPISVSCKYRLTLTPISASCKYRLTLTPYDPCAASTDWPWPLWPMFPQGRWGGAVPAAVGSGPQVRELPVLPPGRVPPGEGALQPAHRAQALLAPQVRFMWQMLGAVEIATILMHLFCRLVFEIGGKLYSQNLREVTYKTIQYPKTWWLLW